MSRPNSVLAGLAKLIGADVLREKNSYQKGFNALEVESIIKQISNILNDGAKRNSHRHISTQLTYKFNSGQLGLPGTSDIGDWQEVSRILSEVGWAVKIHDAGHRIELTMTAWPPLTPNEST